LKLRLVEQSPITIEFEIAHGSKMHVKPNELLAFLQPPNLVPKIVWRITRREMKAADGAPLFDI
jgi:hypothetical protein